MKYFLPMLALVGTLATHVYAQELEQDDGGSLYGEQYVVPGASVHKVQSHIVDQLYELRISLPGDYYSQPDK